MLLKMNLKIGGLCVIAYRMKGTKKFVVVPGVVESVKGSGIWVNEALGRPAEGDKIIGRAFENIDQAREWITEQIEPVVSVL